MLQYKIPQDVQIEDKILGPITLKQLITLAVGGGISYVIFLVLSESYELSIFDYFWICIPFFISAAFAFLRINDVSFLKWILLLFEYNHNSRRRYWDKSLTTRLHYTFVTAKVVPTGKKELEGTEEKQEKEAAKRSQMNNMTSLEKLTMVLDHSSPFSEQEKHPPEDHDDESAIHLSASEKKRHEARLSHSILSAPFSK